jgi:hypothetical protein
MRPSKAVFCALCTLAVLGLAATAGASAQRVSFPIDDTFVDEQLAAECGFEVTTHVAGTVRVLLTLNADGHVAKEIDTFSGFVTFSSDAASFSFPIAQPVFLDYGEGAEIGSTATIKLAGLLGHVPGFIASDAGIIILSGTVLGFDDLGLPIVDFSGEVTFEHGSRQGGERVDAAICAALS